MPWKETSLVNEKRRLVELVQSRVLTMKDACEELGVCRKTGHKWFGRFEENGRAGLEERSRAPLSSPQAWPAETREAVLALKRRRPTWGPKKLVVALKREGRAMPAPSTAGEWLKEAGLVKESRRRSRPSATPTGLVAPKVGLIRFRGRC